MRKFYTVVFTVFFVIAANVSLSQTVNTYSFNQSTTTFTPINAGTLLGSETSDDQRFVDPATLTGGTVNTGVGFAIGFDFTYAGSVYNRVGISNNGWIGLGNSALTNPVDLSSTSQYEPLSSVAAVSSSLVRARIAGIARDLEAQSGSSLRIQTIGTAPNRQFVIQWLNYKRYLTSGTGDNFSFQIILNETSNTVQVKYGSAVFGTSATTTQVAQIGLGGLVVTDFNNRTTIVPHNWNATSAGISNADGAQFSTSTLTAAPPAAGLTFTWAPPPPCSSIAQLNGGTATASSIACLNQPFQLSTTGSTLATGLNYQWQSSPDGVTFSNIPNATTLPYTASQSVTTYYRLLITCAANSNSATSTVVQVNTPAAVSGTFTINRVLGTDLAANRFGSFNAAYDYIKCGINGPVVFNVVAGTGPYSEQLVMAAVPGASNSNTVTFNGNGQTLQFTSTNTNERAVIKLDGADHIRFDNLTISAGGTTTTEYGFGIHLTNNADSNRITNCRININTSSTSTNYAGIVMSASATSATGTGATACDGNFIDGNVITGGYYGLTMVASSTESVRLNTVTNNTIQESYFYGMYLWGNFGSRIENNRITRPTRTSVTTSFYGIYLTGLSTAVNINRNRIYNPYGGAPTNTGTFYGIYFTGVDAITGVENKVINNAIYQMNFAGSAYGLYNLGSDNVWFYHNTVVLDGATTSSTGLARAFYQTTAAGGIELKNNIFYISRTGGSNHLLYFNTAITTANEFVANNNDLHLTTTTGNNFVGYSNGANRSTIVDWRTNTSQDAASVTVNPIFQDPSSENYAPTNSSMDNLGIPVNVLVDITGTTRSTTTPDIGAWEFAPGACVAPPIPGTTTASTNPVCVGFPVSLSVTGNSIGLGQIYQLQASATLAGPYSNVGGTRPLADTVISGNTTLYYRFAVTCGSATTYSTPILVTVTQRMAGGAYTINKNNATDYPTGNNFQTFAAANNALKCGINGAVVFNVVSGTGVYNEQLVIDSIAGASAVNTVTFNGNGNTLKFHSANSDERAVVKLRRADHVRIDSLNIDATGTATYGWGIQLVNNADSNIIRRCVITTSLTSTSTNDAGIVVSNSESVATTTGNTWCDGNLFERNTISGGYYGLTLVGSTNENALQNNTVRGNTIRDFYFYGIYLNGNNNLVVDSNDLYRQARTNGSSFYGIYSLTFGTNISITKNRIHNSFDNQLTSTSVFYGIYLSGNDGTATNPNRVINNAIYNVTGDGDEYGIYNTSSDYVLCYHNTLSFDNQLSQHTTTWWTRAIYLSGAVGLDLKNNIVSITRTGAGDRHAMYVENTAATFIANNNNYYVRGGAGITFTGYYNTDIVSLAAWQAATSQDAASYELNPLFSQVSVGNLRPRQPGIDNKGTSVGVVTDIVGASRSTTVPDMGAWEFAVPTCTAPPPASTTVVTPNSGICRGTPINLTLNGINTIVSGQTYQWQYSTTATGPWTNLGSAMSFPDTTIEATKTYYYRAIVTCSGQSTPSAAALLSLNPALLGGYYTINPAGTGSNNFTSFTAAAAALACGIDDDVWFAAVPGTYNEQVRIGRINGASDTARVTFMSQNGNPASVVLTFASPAASNYTVQLDSTSFVTFRDLTINATSTTSGRAIDITGTASADSLSNLIINLPAVTTSTTAVVGIFANTSNTGQRNIIRRNTINGGTSGIYYAANLGPTRNIKIDSNTVNNPYQYGIYFTNAYYSSLSGNTVSRTGVTATTGYGIYGLNLDSAYQVNGNRVNSTAATTTQYGLYMSGAFGALNSYGSISNNRITITGATGVVYGLYQTGNTFGNLFNNVVSVQSSGASSYALYSTGGGDLRYYNNSINSFATSATNNYAGYFAHTTGAGADVQNNVFAHNGGGRAIYQSNPNYLSADYNMYFTTGSILAQTVTPAATYTNLKDFSTASGWDRNSIVFKPAFTSNTDLSPKIDDSTVWAMHGRGVQLAGNATDINGAARPTTLTAGVPDLGAFEFLPTVEPMPLQGDVAPAANTTQTFMLGTDTVAKITWKATAPATIALRRYSGVLPTGTAANQQRMYFYTKADVTGTTTAAYDLKQFYIDPWQGFIPREAVIRLGRTTAANNWVVDAASRVDTFMNVISRDTLNYIDRFTGLTDPSIAAPPPPVYVQQFDSSNRGKRFWTAYANSYDFANGNAQEMVLYFGAGSQPANVTVRIMGTNWVRNYTVPANTATTSAFIPKIGINDARLVAEGQSPKGILIESDVPISAYGHIYASTNSGATMLLPVGTYGYEYYTLSSRQNYTSSDSYSSFFVVADRDNTQVEITPSNPTFGGRAANTPFTVTLNAGETYQVLGAYISGAEGYDLTGSRVRSVPNSAGKCYPIAVFAGSSRTGLGCGTSAGSGGDLLFQQVFPSQAWGTRYLTAPTSQSATASTLMTNIYRIMVKDPATVVRRNGTIVNGIVNNRYYQYESETADYITADKPIMVAQFMPSSGTVCANNGSSLIGDPEMFYLSPVEQAVKESQFYRNDESAITVNYVTIVIPTAGLSSLLIDGSNTFSHTYTHPNLSGYSVVVKRYAAGTGFGTVSSDSSFTGIVYGMGSQESYGYNVGTLVKNLNAIATISNTLTGTGAASSYTCRATPFRFNILLPLKPTQLTWQFSQVSGLTPNVDVTQNNPAFVGDSVLISNRWYWRYTVAADYQFANTGTFNVPILVTHPTIEGCNNTYEQLLTINVVARPVTNFSTVFSGCVGATAQFTGVATPAIPGATVTAYNWSFGDATTGTGQTVTKTYTAPGTYQVNLRAITSDGCLGDTTKPVVVSQGPAVTLVSDSLTTCPGTPVTLQVANPVAGAVYSWFTTPTGGTAVTTGTSYTANVSVFTVYYVESSLNGCASATRRRAVVAILPNLAAPTVAVTDRTPNSITWSWGAVPNATGYQVSRDNGTTWTTPSSGTGPSALTHTISGLTPLTSVTLVVRALGGCIEARSQPVTGQTPTDQVFIPNSFSPNGDGLNDRLLVYGNVIRSMQFTVFNQWGEKIFESRQQNTGWDGTHKGKMQPSGVYMYVAKLVLNNGQELMMKGSINLVR